MKNETLKLEKLMSNELKIKNIIVEA